MSQNTNFYLFGKYYEALTYLGLVSEQGANLIFGQSGEDAILVRLFRKKTFGFYVDVGAFHPTSYSNTFFLHKLYGWSGINIDASLKTIQQFQEARPNDVNIHIAVSDKSGEAIYHQYAESMGVNTISPKNVERQKQRNLEPTSKDVIKVERLDTLLDQYLPTGQKIDLLNVDVEGVDLNVLQSNNWEKYRPSVVLVEDFEVQKSNLSDENPIYRYMLEQGYRLVSHAFDTSIYAELSFLEDLLNLIPQENLPYVVPEYDFSEPDLHERTYHLVKDHPYFVELDEKLFNLREEIAQTGEGNLSNQFEQVLNDNRELNRRLIEQLTKHRDSELQVRQELWNLQEQYRKTMQELETLKQENQLISRSKEQDNQIFENLAHALQVLRDQNRIYAQQNDENKRLNFSLLNVIEKDKPTLSTEISKNKERLAQLKAEQVKLEQSRLRFLSATEEILNSRSFRYVDWLKNKLLPYKGHGAERPFSAGGTSINKLFRGDSLTEYASRLSPILTRLYPLGFTERAFDELLYIFRVKRGAYRRAAAWELALWHSQFQTEKEYRTVLTYLEFAKEDEPDIVQRRQIAYVEAEAYGALGDLEKAKQIIQAALDEEISVDLYLAMSNYQTSLDDKLEWINKALTLEGNATIQLSPIDEELPTLYDALKYNTNHPQAKYPVEQQVKVTILVPVYNSADMINTALDSLIVQTWQNIEILVIDDCSLDNTVEIVQEYMARDERIKLIQAEKNGGAYVARNLGLQVATGELVTCNDADDWSHPQRIEIQAIHLMENPHLVANQSRLARTTNDLVFDRRPNGARYSYVNMSSLMFRRELLVNTIGYWDSVRFGADMEYALRIRQAFGRKASIEVPNSLLAFPRQASGSLSTHGAFGYWGYPMGARAEYVESINYVHNKNPNLYIDFPLKKRMIPVPDPMLPDRRPLSERIHYDVILVSDFRFPGGTSSANAAEIKAYRQVGLKVGLVKLFRYQLDISDVTNEKIRELVDGDLVRFITYGQKVSCDLMVIQHPSILQDRQIFLPDIEAKQIHVIVNQSPRHDYSSPDAIAYDLMTSIENVHYYFGMNAIWYPVGPAIRDILNTHHQAELAHITLADSDWYNIIDINEWRRDSRPDHQSAPRIGRHARDQDLKWPDNVSKLLMAYPEGPKYDVRILGGAEHARMKLGYIPKNWTVYPFNEISPKEFLQELDVFIYFTHPDLVEAFGRVIFEAMAVGVPVIVPHAYEAIFQSAAIYADFHEITGIVDRLMADPEYYERQITLAQNYIDQRYGYKQHIDRIRNIVSSLPHDEDEANNEL